MLLLADGLSRLKNEFDWKNAGFERLNVVGIVHELL